jgi:dephospho-CoA kinase
MRLIGLTGPAGCGKDTVAGFLCIVHGFVQVSFAKPIRNALEPCLVSRMSISLTAS